MTTDDLRKLALAATRTTCDEAECPYFRKPRSASCACYNELHQATAFYRRACSPERILAMLDVIDAAKAMRAVNYDELGRAFDAALQKLQDSK